MVTGSLFSRDGVGVPERLIMPADASVAASDSVGGEVVADSIPGLSVDSLRVDSLRGKDAFSSVEPGDAAGRGDSVPRRPSRIRREKVDLDHQVVFESKDSMVMVGRNMTYMYGEGQIDYGDLKLNAAEIRLDMDKSEVYACGREDSVGEMQGVPVFEEGGTSYESSTMRYNFRSKRGYITNVITQQGEGFLTGGQTKKTEGEDYYIQNGR